MKTSLKSIGGSIRTATAALLLSGSLAAVCATTTNTPVGPTWDFISSGGGQQGIAFLTFSDDGAGDRTFTGYVLVSGSGKQNSSTSRNSGGSSGRGDSSTSDTNTSVFLYGFTDVSGPWNINTKGQVVGYFTELVNVLTLVTNYGITNVSESIDAGNGDTTNITVFFNRTPTSSRTITWTDPVPFTNTYIFYNPSWTTEAATAEETNAISFVGKVASKQKSFSMVSSTSHGKVTYKGVPAAAAAITNYSGGDFDGSDWYGVKISNNQSFNEFFTLTAGPDQNIYRVDGSGPGYTIVNGRCMISKQKKIGFAFVANGNLRASLGSFTNNKKRASAKTKGTEESIDTPIKFNAEMISP